MGQVRALVTLQSVADVESVAALMKRVASYIEEHFGDRLRFEPFINEDTGRVVWLNAAADEDTLVEWEQAMRETVLPPSPGDRGRSGDRQDLALAGWGLRQPAGALSRSCRLLPRSALAVAAALSQPTAGLIAAAEGADAICE